jgi:hypothetical protein
MDRETIKLVNVLRRIARAAGYAAWVKSDPEASRFCLGQYNKVLARISELEPAIKTLFTPLPDNTSPDVVRIAARELAAYFEDEVPDAHVFKFAIGCGSRRARARNRCFPMTVHCE